jgi:hypothetical protein
MAVLALVVAAPNANAITMPLIVYNGSGDNFTAQLEITTTTGGLLLTITNTSDLSSDAGASAIDKLWLEEGFSDSFDSASIYGTTGTVTFQQGTVNPGTKPNNYSAIGWTSTWDQGYFTRDGNKDDGINALGYDGQNDSLTIFLAFGSNPSLTPFQLYAKILLDPEYKMVAIHANECSPDQSCDAYATPIPATVWLFGSALLGLMGFGSRRRAAA